MILKKDTQRPHWKRTVKTLTPSKKQTWKKVLKHLKSKHRHIKKPDKEFIEAMFEYLGDFIINE